MPIEGPVLKFLYPLANKDFVEFRVIMSSTFNEMAVSQAMCTEVST